MRRKDTTPLPFFFIRDKLRQITDDIISERVKGGESAALDFLAKAFPLLRNINLNTVHVYFIRFERYCRMQREREREICPAALLEILRGEIRMGENVS